MLPGSVGQIISQTPQPTQGSCTTGDLRFEPSGANTVSMEIAPLTGHSRTQLSDARAAGFDSIIVKPCDPDDLVAEIRRLAGAASA